jgi:cytochrome b561
LTVAAVERGKASIYDRVARAAHWLAAALAVVAVSLGWAIEGVPRSTAPRDLLISLHESVGLTLLGTMLFRAGWRCRHRPPPLPTTLARLDLALARCTHFALYLLLILMPLAWYLNAVAAGHAVRLFGVLPIPSPLREDDRLSQAAIAVHLIAQYPLYLLVGLHTAGALYHGALRRDGILDRMLPRRRSA